MDYILAPSRMQNICFTDLMKIEFHPGIMEASDKMDAKYATFTKDPRRFAQKCGREMVLKLLSRR